MLLLLVASIAAMASDARLAKISPPVFEAHGDSYVSRGAGYALSLSPSGAVLAVPGGRVRMRMVGGNAAARLEALGPLPAFGTYGAFERYGQVLSRSVYPGIDLLFHGNGTRLEYDFRVAAGSSARQIALAFEGADGLKIDARGDLVLHAGATEIRQPMPVAYQVVNGQRRDVAVSYRLDKLGRVRFRLGPHDSRRELVIDPTLVFDKVFGVPYSAAGAVALDAQGNVYVAGEVTLAPGGPAGDIFVEKWNAAGDQLIYSAHLGGNNGTDQVTGMVVDSSGSAYVVGATGSPNFTVTSNAFQKKLIGNRNAFVAKLRPDGTGLVYASFLGGGYEQTGGIAVDASGAAYLTGSTVSNFPVTANAFQKTPGSNCTVNSGFTNYATTGDAFVAKISPDGASLEYSSYLGGGCGDFGYGIAANADGTAWVVGATFSPNFPVTVDALQPVYGGGFGDGFLVQVSAEGDRLAYSTFLGGTDYDTINAITSDSAGNLYLTGASNGFSQPASRDAYQPHSIGYCLTLDLGPPIFNIDGNAFVMKLNPTGTAITGLTYIGSACEASGSAIAVDSADAPWIVGFGSPSFPMASPLELQAGGFVSKFSADLTQLLFSTTVSGSALDIAIDASGMAYLAGAANPPGGASATAFTRAYVAEIDAAPIAVSLDNVLSASPFLQPGEGEMLAPGKVIRVVGRGIGPAVKTPGVIKGGVLASTVAHVKVTFDGVAAPLLYVSSTEIGCIVPYAIAGRSTTKLQVTYNGVASNAVPVPLQATSPEVLGVYNSDFSPNSASNPAKAGSIVILYLTGAGQTVPASTDGEVYAPPLPRPESAITIEGPLPVTFAGAADGLADGILQVNFQAPPALPAQLENGLTLSAGPASTNFILYVK
jgi:uncharacterized protein (TIGR03437 family)